MAADDENEAATNQASMASGATRRDAAPPRVDERILGTGTGVRFVLLLALIMASSSAMALQVAPQLFTTRYGLDCLLAAGVDPSSTSAIDSAIATISQQGPYLACMNRNAPPPPWWLPVAWPLLVLTAGAGLFALRSAFAAGRRTVPLAQVDSTGEIAAALVPYSERVPPGRRPRYVVDPAARSVGAVVSGRTDKPTVCLHGGLLASRRTDPTRFRAVLMHEIAHIHNADITLTYLTVAIWRAFVVLTVLPHLVLTAVTTIGWWGATFGSSQMALGVRALLLSAMLFVLVTLARTDVLRTRELHADSTAVRWGADPASWRTFPPPPSNPAVRALRRFTSLWDTHPRWQVRRDSLDEPVALFHIQPLPLVLTGAAALLLNAHLTVSLAQFRVWPYGAVGQWSQQAVALATAGLVVAVLGIAVWRAVAYAALTGRAGPSGVRIGCWLGIGMAVGELAAHRTGAASWLPARPQMLLLLVVGCVFVTCWTVQSAQLSVSVWRGRRLGPAMLLGLVAGCLAMAVWLSWWVTGGGAVLIEGWPFTYDGVREHLSQWLSGATAERPADVSTVTVIATMTVTLWSNVVSAPLAPLGIVLLWVLPLLGWLTRSRTTVPPWMRHAVVDAKDDDTEAFGPPTSPPGPRRMLLTAVVLGSGSWVAAFVVRAALDGAGSGPVWQQGDRSIRYLAGMATVLLIGAALAALLGARASGRFRLIGALICANVAVLIGFVGIAVLLGVDGCAYTPNSPWLVCDLRPAPLWVSSYALLFGFLGPVLLLTAIIASVLAACSVLFDRRRMPTEQSALGVRRARGSRARGFAIAVLALVPLSISVLQGHRVLLAHAVQPDPALIAQTAQQTLGAADAPVSAHVKALQVDAWRRNGGDWLLQHVDSTRERYVRTLRDLEKRPHLTWQYVSARLDPICAEFGRLSGIAGDYFRIPDRRADVFWQATISLSRTGGQDCREALDRQRNPLLQRAHDDLMGSFEGLTPAVTRLNAIEQDGFEQE